MRNGGSRTYEGNTVVTATDRKVSLYGNRETAKLEESCCLTFSPRQARAIARRILELTEEELESGFTLSPRADLPLVPGKAGTVSADQLSTFAMGDGTGKECRVVYAGSVKLYVGIGWIVERKATQEDCDLFPMVV